MVDPLHSLPSAKHVAGALLGAALLACGGDDADGADRLLAAQKDITRALCACGLPLDFTCTEIPARDACVTDVLRAHEGALEPYVECIVSELHATATCIERAMCAPDRIEACVKGSSETARCGVPDDLDDTIDDELDHTCPTAIDCDDGSIEPGGICDGAKDCRDGSDELGCSTGGGAQSGLAGVDGGVAGSGGGGAGADGHYDTLCENDDACDSAAGFSCFGAGVSMGACSTRCASHDECAVHGARSACFGLAGGQGHCADQCLDSVQCPPKHICVMTAIETSSYCVPAP